MTRAFPIVAFEALVVGLLVLGMFYVFKMIGVKNHWTAHIIGGALIHIIFEYSPFGNLNEKWCRATFE